MKTWGPTLLLAAVAAAALGCVSAPAVQAGRCQVVRGMPGPEDVELDTTRPGARRLLVSSVERRVPGTCGAIFAVPLGTDGVLGTPVTLALDGRSCEGFSPAGISLVTGATPPRLYVVNHIGGTGHAIEVYEVEADRLRFRERLMDPLLHSPNDVAALPDGQLYVTNMGWSPGPLQFLGILLSFRRGTVVHYKDGRWTRAADDIAYANGIALAPDGRALYVAGLRDHAIHVYPRDPRTGAVGPREASIAVGSNVDNLSWADADALTVAAHPSLLRFARHFRDTTHRAPSEVYRVDIRRRQAARIFTDDGTTISAASTGVLVDGRLYLGQVADDAVVACPIRGPR